MAAGTSATDESASTEDGDGLLTRLGNLKESVQNFFSGKLVGEEQLPRLAYFLKHENKPSIPGFKFEWSLSNEPDWKKSLEISIGRQDENIMLAELKSFVAKNRTHRYKFEREQDLLRYLAEIDTFVPCNGEPENILEVISEYSFRQDILIEPLENKIIVRSRNCIYYDSPKKLLSVGAEKYQCESCRDLFDSYTRMTVMNRGGIWNGLEPSVELSLIHISEPTRPY